MYETHSEKKSFFLITQFFIIISVNLFSCCCCLVAKSYPTLLWPHGLQSTRLPCPWNFPGKRTGVGYRLFLQRIFPTQGSNPHLLHWQVDSLPGNPLLFLLLLFFFFFNLFIWLCWILWHVGNLLHHVRSFVAVHEHRLSSCDARVK